MITFLCSFPNQYLCSTFLSDSKQESAIRNRRNALYEFKNCLSSAFSCINNFQFYNHELRSPAFITFAKAASPCSLSLPVAADDCKTFVLTVGKIPSCNPSCLTFLFYCHTLNSQAFSLYFFSTISGISPKSPPFTGSFSI